jgi:hypothetical protein
MSSSLTLVAIGRFNLIAHLLEEERMGIGKELDLPFLELDVILDATVNFSEDCKIGQGGFGCVYMVG